MISYNIAVYDIITSDLIGVYLSLEKASQDLYIDPSTLHQYVKGNVKNPHYNIQVLRKHCGFKTFKLLDSHNDNKVVAFNKSSRELAKQFKTSNMRINQCSSNNKRLHKRYWVKECSDEERLQDLKINYLDKL